VSINAMPAVDELALPEALRLGLREIRNRVLADAAVAAIIDNFAVFDLGTMVRGGPDESAQLPEIFQETAIRLFARVANNFPLAEPYGLITIPTLHRVDGHAIERQHSPHPIAEAFATRLGESDAAFWSWDWKGMPRREPGDLVAIVEWARKRIRQG
jgi:hypothetical protein